MKRPGTAGMGMRMRACGAGLRISLAVHGHETGRCRPHPARHAQAVNTQSSRLPHSKNGLAHLFTLRNRVGRRNLVRGRNAVQGRNSGIGRKRDEERKWERGRMIERGRSYKMALVGSGVRSG